MFAKVSVLRAGCVLVLAAVAGVAVFPAVATAALVGEYHFDGDLNDTASSPANLFVYSGAAPTYVPGVLGLGGQAISMVYNNSSYTRECDSADVAKYQTLGGTYTVEAFINLTSPIPTDSRIVTHWGPWFLGARASQQLWCLEQNSGGTADFTGGALVVNRWQHIAITGDGTALKLWLNGAVVGSQGYNGTMNTSGGPLQINNMNTGFTGVIDDVKIWSGEAKDQAYMQSRYNLIFGAPEDIPEPATMALLGLAVTGLGGYIRRRRTA